MTEHESDDTAAWGTLGEIMNRVRSGLQEGGPPVDRDQLFDLIGGDLSDEEALAVTTLIRTWRNWHEEYWKLHAYLDLAENDSSDQNASPVANSLTTPLEKTIPTIATQHRNNRLLPILVGMAVMLVVGISLFLLPVGGQSAVAELIDGERRIILKSNGQFVGLPAISTSLVDEIRHALLSKSIAPLQALPAIVGMRSDSDPMSASVLLRPFRTNVSEARPTFRWKGTAKALSYVVHVYDDSAKVISESSSLKEPTWISPESLPRGRTYSWDVLVTFEDGTTVLPQGGKPRPVFRILSDDEFARYQQAITDLRSSHLALGTFFAREALLDEAQDEFDILVRSNPDSREVNSLANSVRALRE